MGLLTFVGLAAGMLVQPIAGQWSDRLRYRNGRHVFVGAGAAAAGLLGPLVDWGNSLAWGRGYTFLFLAAAGAFLASILLLHRRQDAPVPTPSYGEELL